MVPPVGLRIKLLVLLFFLLFSIQGNHNVFQERFISETMNSQSTCSRPTQETLNFNGSRAFTFLEAQCAFGPRPPGSGNLTLCGDYIISILQESGWPVQNQTWTHLDTPLRNIVAGAYLTPRWIILAHYDTRPIADRDPSLENRSKPILGANDGASGAAALLELAQILPLSAKYQIALLFVDAEDSGGVGGWDWIVGSTYYVNNLNPIQRGNIQATILLDMIGDADLQLKRERTSTPDLGTVIWQIAGEMNYSDVFLNTPGFSIVDDHHPFLQAGIPALDIIDFDYPWWHTLEDTPNKCSPDSLEAVGRVVEYFLLTQLASPTTFRNFWSNAFGTIILGVITTIVTLAIVYILYMKYWRRRET